MIVEDRKILHLNVEENPNDCFISSGDYILKQIEQLNSSKEIAQMQK
jgi:hypothetical protein